MGSLKNLWKKWCDKVDKHNAKLDNITHGECWGYYTIFVPVLSGVVTFLLFFLVAQRGIKVSISSALGIFIGFSAMLYLNWKASD